MSNHPSAAVLSEEKKKKEEKKTAAETYSYENAESEGTDEEDSEWKEYYGLEMWRKERDLKRNNPFDHRAHLAKGEKIENFEALVAITFKTLRKLVDNKQEIKGLLRHGQTMAEKASKKVYHLDAFVKYDEAVRERAGRVGPTAFGTVIQEDVLTHFCYDNTIRARQQLKTNTKEKRPKSDKTCNRYNDSGCFSKTCNYQHKCQSCDQFGHGRRDCKSQDKKKENK